MRKGKTLSCLILGTLAAAGILGGGTVFAEEPAVTQLAEVVVIGDRNKEREVLPGDFVYTKSQTGFLSGKNTLDVPWKHSLVRINRWMRFSLIRHLFVRLDRSFMATFSSAVFAQMVRISM